MYNIYIYTHYVYNPHLGLIKAPPYFCSSPNDLFHYSFTIKKARHILNSGQDLINLTGDTGWAILGAILGVILAVILGVIHFLSKRDPPQK